MPPLAGASLVHLLSPQGHEGKPIIVVLWHCAWISASWACAPAPDSFFFFFADGVFLLILRVDADTAGDVARIFEIRGDSDFRSGLQIVVRGGLRI
jgi:hypothetical protein